MRKLMLITLLAISIIPAASQQANIWYFGDEAGLNFNPSPTSITPTVVTDGKMKTDEGCSSICDMEGNLLFYSNGVTVYNREHKTMLNGDGLGGNNSTLQACMIIQRPGQDSIYYVFTADAIENGYANGYRYSIVNMKHDNGKGEVVSKNNLLWSSASERMTAARHANGTHVWLITNDNNSATFRAWLIDCNGLQTTPVTSVIGDAMNQHVLSNIGTLKVSPDGKQICQTHFPEPEVVIGQSVSNYFQLFDFDNASGVISNVKKISIPDIAYFTCEYSPNSELLYVTAVNDTAIDQFEARLASIPLIAASRTRIGSGSTTATLTPVYGMQLAPDGKIYLSRFAGHLDVINYPDVKGPGCNYRMAQVYLKGKLSRLQLPSSINDIPKDPYNNFTYQVLDSCSGLVQFTGFTLLTGTVQWHWDFGDGQTSNQQNPVHQFVPSKQTYVVKLTITSGTLCSRNFNVTKPVYPSGQATKVSFDLINVCDSGYVRLSNTSDPSMLNSGTFIWDFGDGNTSTEINPIHYYTGQQVYTIRLSYTTLPACLNDFASRTVSFEPYVVDAIPDQTILVSQSIRLYVNADQPVSYQWSPETWLDQTNVRNPFAVPLDDITYIVSVTAPNGCVGKDSVHIKVLPLDDIFIPSGFTPNGDGKNETIYPLFGTHLTLTEFSVYNRWGQQLFSTRMRGYGWDGKANGQPQGSGVYVYFFRLTDSTGKLYNKKGTITLIR